MASELQRELYQILRQAQDKYTYFLLAAAGAAIGLAVSQTQGACMAWSQIPLALAVLSWGFSFYFGCRYIAYVNSIIYANVELLGVQSGEHPSVGTHPDAIQAAGDGIRSAMTSNSERGNILGRRQFRLLVSGGAFYGIWHLLEMYLCT